MGRELVERELTSAGVVRRRSARGKRRTARVNLAESPLSWLHARGHIDDRQFDAGECLRADFERAQLGPKVTMSWEPVQIKGRCKGGGNRAGLSATESQLAAKQRFDSALAQAGRGLQDILWRVVCAGEGLPAAERELHWPARSGKLVLKIALDRVADFYRVA